MLLFLNDFGTGELLFIMLAVLVLFGAKSIPSFARTLGKGMREIKAASDEIKRDITSTVTDIRREVNINQEKMFDKSQETKNLIKNPIEDLSKDIKEASKEINESVDKMNKPSSKSDA